MPGHHGQMSLDGVPEELSRDDCLSRLLGRHRGRIGLSLRSLPTILPVTYAVEGDGVVVSTMATAHVRSAVYDNVVTFQVDDVDARTEQRWSVSVTGIARPSGPGAGDPWSVGGPAVRSPVVPLSASIPTVMMHGVLL